MRKSDVADLNELQRVPTQSSPDDANLTKEDPIIPSSNMWARIKWLHDRGLWAGDYKETPVQTYKLNKGPHYYIIENPRSGSIKCISCAIQHGGVLEARFMTRYKVEGGVLYFDGKAINKAPEDFHQNE